MRSAAAFAEALSSALDRPLSRPETDRAVEIARVSVERGGVVLTASESLLLARYLLYALNVDYART